MWQTMTSSRIYDPYRLIKVDSACFITTIQQTLWGAYCITSTLLEMKCRSSERCVTDFDRITSRCIEGCDIREVLPSQNGFDLEPLLTPTPVKLITPLLPICPCGTYGVHCSLAKLLVNSRSMASIVEIFQAIRKSERSNKTGCYQIDKVDRNIKVHRLSLEYARGILPAVWTFLKLVDHNLPLNNESP